MPETSTAPSSQVVLTEFDNGEGIIVDLHTKRYYQLNETALLIWKGLEKTKSLNEIVGEMVAVYEVTPDHAKQSVESLLQNLGDYKLLSR